MKVHATTEVCPECDEVALIVSLLDLELEDPNIGPWRLDERCSNRNCTTNAATPPASASLQTR